jgi:hypothetical protein
VFDGGWEIMFHVAPLMTPDERRQYVGNDKYVVVVVVVVVVFCDVLTFFIRVTT